MATKNTFRINGVEFSRQPTNHRWVNPEPYGVTGDGHPSYPAYYEYDLEFDFATPQEYYSFMSYWNSIGLTGTASVDLPEHPLTANNYQFRTYSGVVINHPQYEDYFENYYARVRMRISRIRIR
jgi:hypothetical protein